MPGSIVVLALPGLAGAVDADDPGGDDDTVDLIPVDIGGKPRLADAEVCPTPGAGVGPAVVRQVATARRGGHIARFPPSPPAGGRSRKTLATGPEGQ